MGMFKKAEKKQLNLRMALIGISGSGKTFTALNLAQYLGDSVALIDTEHESASKYAHKFNFDTCALDSFSPKSYRQAIEGAAEAGYDVLIIDSLSHAWMGKDGALEMVNNAQTRGQGNSFAAWKDVTPEHNKMVEAILSYPGHVIVTMRAKTEYVMEEYETNGRVKTRPVKKGVAPIQKADMEYEFDVTATMDLNNNMVIDKSRCEDLTGKVFNQPGKDVVNILKPWLGSGKVEDSKPQFEKVDQPTEIKPKSNKDILAAYALEHHSQAWDEVRKILKAGGIDNGAKLAAMTTDQLDEAKQWLDDAFTESVA
jgi:ABC-type dipeptide/oligopeptide/nickel transport system ATPase component